MAQRSKSDSLMKAIVEMKRENEELEKMINFVKAENFDYALKCNHMEQVLKKIQATTKIHPKKLADVCQDTYNILQIPDLGKEKSIVEDKTVNKLLSQQSALKSSPQNKAHVVKPHMVNGHILYEPTINLTRVSNLNTQIENSPGDRLMVDENSGEDQMASQGSSHENDTEIRETSGSHREFHNENELTTIAEVSEPSTSSSSKSPSHSTVLSGTFQEVKIYLNQVSSESLQEEPSTSKKRTKRRSAKQPNSALKSHRPPISDCVTKRKKK